MLKVWNVSPDLADLRPLRCSAPSSCAPGVLQSIHAFGASTVGAPLLVLIACRRGSARPLIVTRLDDLRPERRIDSLLSRESIFLVNNLLLVGLAAVIFWGTFFPLISEFFTGDKSSLAAPWFDRYVTPLAILLVLFTGIGPLLAWGRLSGRRARRLLLWPALAAVATIAGRCWRVHRRRRPPWALVRVRLRRLRPGGARRRVLAGRSRAPQRSPASRYPARCARAVTARNRRRYGGYIVHAGIAHPADRRSPPRRASRPAATCACTSGSPAKVGDYTVTYRKPTADPQERADRLRGAARRQPRRQARSRTLNPSRNYYPTQRPDRRGDRPLLRGRGDERGRPRPAAGGDLWTALQPDLSGSTPTIDRGNRELAGPAARTRRGSRSWRSPSATRSIRRRPTSASSSTRWSAGSGSARLIALAGALIAVWPALEARRRLGGGVRGAARRELGKADPPA